MAKKIVANYNCSFVTLIIFFGAILTACNLATPAEPELDTSISNEQTTYEGKRIVWVNSYHQGYDGSDGIELGLRDVFDKTNVELKVIRMDTKRNIEEDFGQAAAISAQQEIEAFQPDVIIATDDNAQKYLIEPYYKGGEIPVVFAAVNWDASVYGYPAKNVTGMVEVELIEPMMELLKPYAQGDRVAFIGPDVISDQKIANTYNERFFDNQLEIRMVKDFDEFKDTFIALQDEVDIVIFGNNIGIVGFDEAEAEAFMLENTRIPTGAYNTWTSPFVLLSVTKEPTEQGEWAAQTALRILDGTAVTDIPIVENQKGNLLVNLDMAEQLDIAFPPSVLKNAETYSSEE